MPDDPTSAPPPPVTSPPELFPPSNPSRIAGFARFSGGCLIVLAVSGAVAAAAFGDLRHLLGCAALQLVWLVPAVGFLFRKQKRPLAFGMIFGGAIVFLLASLCSGPMDFK
jgi:hypothetical protein